MIVGVLFLLLFWIEYGALEMSCSSWQECLITVISKSTSNTLLKTSRGLVRRILSLVQEFGDGHSAPDKGLIKINCDAAVV
ncbi:unnamed protein product [Trifolium pratense]|uniref:Uncharacterized protein n=1 Tax=Trifolium pratense TaxID=57577 RepID=A0ACB0M7Q3_TRIPR|nr:unnamed protein product [Trifolium pratense]